jgi:predicted RNA-binding Zn-ribbon protein involved in translation (DUF1610 family)
MVAKTTESARWQREWRRRRRASWRQVCASCGDVFVPSRRDAIFCCPACAQRDYRRRKASGEPASRRATSEPWRVFEAAEPSNTGPTAAAAPGAAVRAASGKMIDVAALIG